MNNYFSTPTQFNKMCDPTNSDHDNFSSVVFCNINNYFNNNFHVNSNFSDELLFPEITNFTNPEGPPELLFHQNFTVILVYSFLFLIAAVGNLTVFISLFRSRHRKSRISLMIRHLAIADLIVTFIMIPIEVGWRLTGKWIAGNVACKVFLFLRAFGPYLSSNVLVCVSLDRYFAVLHPLKVNDARRRGKIMLACAWGTSIVYCIPQSFVFQVKAHPVYPNYEQCVSFGFFTSTAQEIAYNLVCVMCMYFIPLSVIIIAYTAIMCEIIRNSRDIKGDSHQIPNSKMRLRRSDVSNIERARSKTLRMTVTIVAVYIWCCTPYVIITMWYMFDRASATSLPEWLQDAFFMMVVSNSCMNPIVYGSYVINFQQISEKCTGCWCCCHGNNTNADSQNNKIVKSRLHRNLTNNRDTMTDLHQAQIVAVTAERNKNLAQGFIKRVLRFKRAESGVTKTSQMIHNVEEGRVVVSPSPPPYTPNKKILCGDPPVVLFKNAQQQLTNNVAGRNVAHIAFLTEPSGRSGRNNMCGRHSYKDKTTTTTTTKTSSTKNFSFHSEPCSYLSNSNPNVVSLNSLKNSQRNLMTITGEQPSQKNSRMKNSDSVTFHSHRTLDCENSVDL